MTEYKNPAARPELLAPAGSRAALEAAVEAGADAVYLGLPAFGARAYAKNFTLEDFSESVRTAHRYGVRVYVTMNTLVFDREADEWLRQAYEAADRGADALILADIGAARLMRRYLPDVHIHASTQMSGHNAEAAKRLADLGFSRMVCARELSGKQIAELCQESPIEIEQFIHGALCVSVSGQCLMSSMIGGRSGNRGECAQPCRLPYKTGYPLSLKDLCLAEHCSEVCGSGVASLKIEGRMKAPEYVYGVTKIYRRLIDENRAATKEEMRELASIFSRDGFTDAYYTGRAAARMNGVRREEDKADSGRAAAFAGLQRKIPVTLRADILRGQPMNMRLTLEDGTFGEAIGVIPEEARTSPLSAADAEKSLSKLGATAYRAERVSVRVDDGLMVPVSLLNRLRRDAAEDLEKKICPVPSKSAPCPERAELRSPKAVKKPQKIGFFRERSQITANARAYFDATVLPLALYEGDADGAELPPLCYPGEEARLAQMLTQAKERGAKFFVIQNVAQLSVAQATGLPVWGGFRLNITNRESAAYWEEQGLELMTLSPELSAARCRDIGGNTAAILYGRIPLMLTEKCVMHELTDCGSGRNCPKKAALVDRTGTAFPVLRRPEDTAFHGFGLGHRTEIFNSLPTGMSDKQAEIAKNGLICQAFLFSDESPERIDTVVDAYKNGRALPFPVRRLP